MQHRYKKQKDILLHISCFGFNYIYDKRICCNFLNPLIFEFFPEARERDKPMADFELPPFQDDADEPFLDTDGFKDYIKLRNLKYIRYIDRRLIRCYDGKFRKCKHYKVIIKIELSEEEVTTIFAGDPSLVCQKYCSVAGVFKGV